MTAPGNPNLSHRPVLVLDFDGTVCLGDGPVWAYADGVLPHLAPELASGIRGQLTAYLDPTGEHPLANGYAGSPSDGSGAGFADGYSAIAALAGPHLPADVLGAAYTASRASLEGADVDIHAPAGLAELLDTLGPSVHRVVVTNAPSTGLQTALTRLGLATRIDEVIASADKPASSTAVLTALLDGAPVEMLMSIGDLWVNDIEPALLLGCATAFIDRSGRDRRPAHVRARTIDELYPAIAAWARSPHTFVHEHAAEIAAPNPTPDRSTS